MKTLDLITLTTSARVAAYCLSYDDNREHIKGLLFEMARRLEEQDIRAHKKVDGLLLVDSRGGGRFATLKERLLYRFFNVLPRKM